MNADQYFGVGMCAGMAIAILFNYFTTYQTLKDTRRLADSNEKRLLADIAEKRDYILKCIDRLSDQNTRSTVLALRLRSNEADDMGKFLKQYGEYLRGDIDYEDLDLGKKKQVMS